MKSAIHFVKIALLLIGTASTIFTAMKLTIPSVISTLLTSSPTIWVAAQLIVLLIWKLSHKKPPACTPPQPYKPPDTPSLVVQPETHTQIDPPSTTPELKPVSVMSKTMNKSSSVREKKHDSIDATWKAIVEGGPSSTRRVLKKSDTWEGPAHVEVGIARQGPVAGMAELRKSATTREAKGWRRREALVVGQDELSGRVEAFIKMHHDHLRLQRQESEHRRVTDMVNHAY